MRSQSRMVLLKVGLSWRQGERRWSEVWQPFVADIARLAAGRLAAEGLVVDGAQVVECRKLRASAGGTLMGSILEDIGEADVLAFDLSPRVGEQSGPGNVLIEVGAALALKKHVFLASSASVTRICGCSDVAGHYVAKISRKKFDPSLRMALVHAVVRAWIGIHRANNGDLRKRAKP